MEASRSGSAVLLSLFVAAIFAASSVPSSSSSLRDPSGAGPVTPRGTAAPDRADVPPAAARGEMRCCNECSCGQGYCVCTDRSRFGCFRDCGFCECYEKPERTCYCIDVLDRCPPSCVVVAAAAAGE